MAAGISAEANTRPLRSCYTIGTISAPRCGGVTYAGYSVADYCYYLSEDETLVGAGLPGTYEQFNSGMVAWSMQRGVPVDEQTGVQPLVWGQRDLGETYSLPFFEINEAYRVRVRMGTGETIYGFSLEPNGDCNLNTYIDNVDFGILCKTIVDLTPADGAIDKTDSAQVTAADVNGDGVIDARDAMLLELMINHS